MVFILKANVGGRVAWFKGATHYIRTIATNNTCEQPDTWRSKQHEKRNLHGEASDIEKKLHVEANNRNERPEKRNRDKQKMMRGRELGNGWTPTRHNTETEG